MSGVYNPNADLRRLDVGAIRDRAEAAQMSQLQRLAAQRGLDQGARLDAALPGIAAALGSSDTSTRRSGLIELAKLGERGLAMASPLLQAERENDDSWMASGAPPAATQPAPAAFPQVAAAASPAGFGGSVVGSGPAPAAAPNGGIRAQNADAARRREWAMANLTGAELEAELASISGGRAQAANGVAPGTPFRANPGVGGVFAGLPAPTGAVPVINASVAGDVLPIADTGAAARPAARPAPGPQPNPGAPSPDLVSRARAAAARGNQNAARWLQVNGLTARAPQSVAPGGALVDPVTGRVVYERPDRESVLLSPEVEAQRARLAGAGRPSVTIDQRTDNARLRVDADTAKGILESATQARGLLSLFDRAEQAVRVVPEGAGAQLVPILGQMARGLGFEVAGASEAEVLRSLTGQLAVLQRTPGSGATSDFEMNIYMNAVPKLGNTRQGSLSLIDMGRRLARRRIEEANIYRRHLGQPDLIDRLDALPPVFSPAEQKMLDDAVGIDTPDTTAPAGPNGRGTAAPPAAAASPRPRARNAEGQVLEYDGSAWVPAQ